MTTIPFPIKTKSLSFDNNGLNGTIEILKFSNYVFIRINREEINGMGNIIDISTSVTPKNLIGESCNNILLLSLSSIIQEYIGVLSCKYNNSSKYSYIIESNLSNDHILKLFFSNNKDLLNIVKKYIEDKLFKR